MNNQLPQNDYDPLEWKFVQSFGDDNSGEDDLVTAVEFDDTGDYLAVGDKAGRICIFEAHTSNKSRINKRGSISGTNPNTSTNSLLWPIEYKFYTEFQSHEPEFDCLKSCEIEEKINMIKFSQKTQNGLFLLATNDKTIKYWKVHDKKIRRPVHSNRMNSSGGNVGVQTDAHTPVHIPLSTTHQTITMATLKRVYANAHAYHINSISINSDGTTFISADDLRVNLWSLDVSDTSYNVIDLKPPNLEELTEVITSAIFHPIQCNVLLYTSSRGTIRLCDLRDSSHGQHNVKQFENHDDPSNRSFFSEIISSISDAKFTPDGRYIISRDYMSLKIWDINMDNKPIAVVPTHDYLVPHLADLYENDCIFDKFECAASYDSTRYVTGSYNNHFVIYSQLSQSSVMIEALKDAPKLKYSPRQSISNRLRHMKKKDKMLMAQQPNVQAMDFAKKALHVAWHPKANCIAIAGLNKLYIYQAFTQNDLKPYNPQSTNNASNIVNEYNQSNNPSTSASATSPVYNYDSQYTAYNNEMNDKSLPDILTSPPAKD